MQSLKTVEVPIEGGTAGPGQIEPILHEERGELFATPSQTAQLEPGEKDCGRQLRMEDHTGGDEVTARREDWSSHEDGRGNGGE
jgi:hypothetical protein